MMFFLLSLSVKVSVKTLLAIKPQGHATWVGLVFTGMFVPQNFVAGSRSAFVTTGVQVSLTSATVRKLPMSCLASFDLT